MRIEIFITTLWIHSRIFYLFDNADNSRKVQNKFWVLENLAQSFLDRYEFLVQRLSKFKL